MRCDIDHKISGAFFGGEQFYIMLRMKALRGLSQTGICLERREQFGFEGRKK